MVYLDCNATTPVDPRVREAMIPFFSDLFGNPSSSHPPGRKGREALERARAGVAGAIGAAPGEIIFTSGGTEADHLAVLGTAYRHGSGHVVISAVEHPAVAEPCAWLKSRGFEVTVVPVDETGRLRLDELESSLRPDTVLISVMHANNEVGTVQPLASVAALARERGIPFHSDAAQSVGKIPVDVKRLGVDLLTVAGHKLYGPKGIGALYVREGVSIVPLQRGGGQERGMRAGTENVPLAVGLGTACRLAASEPWGERAGSAAEDFSRLLAEAVPGARRNGNPDHRLPNTVHVTFPGVSAADLLRTIENDVAASAGSACHATDGTPSGVLHAMGFDAGEARSSVRFSTGKDTSGTDIRRAVDVIAAAVAGLSKQD